MKTKFTLLVISSSLVMAAPALLAQNTNTNTLPLTEIVKCQAGLEKDRALGEQCLLSASVKKKLMLTAVQRTELKPFEKDFAKTSQEYQTANHPRIDAAQEASRQACASKNTAQIQAARNQLQQAWAGLEPSRKAAVEKIKPLLLPEQVAVLQDPKNQWRDIYAAQANEPSAN